MGVDHADLIVPLLFADIERGLQPPDGVDSQLPGGSLSTQKVNCRWEEAQ